MGGACLYGWLSSEDGIASGLSNGSFMVVEPSESHRERLETELGVKCVSSIDDISGDSPVDMVLLAVKPQVLPDVLRDLSESALFDENGTGASSDLPIVLSIAAGISTSDIESSLPYGVHVVRAMPNMPLQVKHGATAVCGGCNASEEDIEVANDLFAALGTSHVVDESLIDAICAISGGGPAYVAYMIEALRDAGASLGLEPELAESLALETVGGTYDTMAEKGLSAEEMRVSVCSPGGTTLAALSELDAAGFKSMFDDAMKAAVNRASELREGA